MQKLLFKVGNNRQIFKSVCSKTLNNNNHYYGSGQTVPLFLVLYSNLFSFGEEESLICFSCGKKKT